MLTVAVTPPSVVGSIRGIDFPVVCTTHRPMKEPSAYFCLAEIPSGERRMRILASAALTVSSFVAFICLVAFWSYSAERPSDTRVIVAMVLNAIAMGVANGTHALLRRRGVEPELYATDPGFPDACFLIASFFLTPIACYLGFT